MAQCLAFPGKAKLIVTATTTPHYRQQYTRARLVHIPAHTFFFFILLIKIMVILIDGKGWIALWLVLLKLPVVLIVLHVLTSYFTIFLGRCPLKSFVHWTNWLLLFGEL